MDGKLQQLTTTTVVITAITISANNSDGVLIATTRLTPRAAIIKLKISKIVDQRLVGWLQELERMSFKFLRSDWHGLTLT